MPKINQTAYTGRNATKTRVGVVKLGENDSQFNIITLGESTPTEVSFADILATDKVFLQRISPGSSTALGALTYVITPGVGFTIASVDPTDPSTAEAGDSSTIAYMVVREVV